MIKKNVGDPGGSASHLPGQDKAGHAEWVHPDGEPHGLDRDHWTQVLVMRWAILLAYLGLGIPGILPVNPLALAGSAGWIAITNVLCTWYWAQRRRVSWYEGIFLYLDFISVLFAMLAVANLDYPVWLALVMLMIQTPEERPTGSAALFNTVCVGGYVFAAVAIELAGWHSVDVGIAAVTLVMLSAIAANLAINLDGSRRLYRLVQEMAVTDSLTGLANRRRLSHFLASPPAGASLAVVVMDIDRFKQYNDDLGHLSGDRLLVQLANVLREAFPDAAIISRYGGDEFVVLLTCRTMEEAEARVRYLLTGTPGRPVPVSVGVSMWPGGHPTLDAAFAAADDCLRAAKRSQRGSFAVWSTGGHIELRAA